MTRGMKGNPRDEPLVRTSKTLSWMLRHGAANVGLQMRKDGYVDVQDLLRLQQFRELTFEHLREIVAKDQKQRYNLTLDSETSVWMIRANQGHSIKDVTLDMQKLMSATDVPMAVHGTTEKAWESIQRQGLSRMNRQHIHLAQGIPDSGVMSGMRTSSRIIIHIDLARALDAGVPLFLSANGVVLTPGDDRGLLRPQLFSRVQRRGASGWEDVPVPVLSPEEAAEAEAEAVRTMEALAPAGRGGRGRGGGRGGRGGGRGKEPAQMGGEDVRQTRRQKGKGKEGADEEPAAVEVSEVKTTITSEKGTDTVVEGIEAISLKS
ncbi:hypothetical protein CONPUDRAFT_107060 [Coniophora puteana RWD-64-598 SS2]|uniref:2'-phosphotransferase n=1 Tax=Coniophora puteana (strain RWD-64-598) TaxID=741705 RepID=A0A5M3MK37_CONPW|nr:uncharacterized protein CONPUDRAFT_107060 [Coniophora puteana RWD-64-598 SS2]EIW79025.1 hypothetical protein CONPUDRAFT_107060 [Coniophora puteana RWD-64-598 SS2]